MLLLCCLITQLIGTAHYVTQDMPPASLKLNEWHIRFKLATLTFKA